MNTVRQPELQMSLPFDLPRHERFERARREYEAYRKRVPPYTFKRLQAQAWRKLVITGGG